MAHFTKATSIKDWLDQRLAVEKLENLCDVLIFEGAGGLLVPIDDKHMIIDLIKTKH